MNFYQKLLILLSFLLCNFPFASMAAKRQSCQLLFEKKGSIFVATAFEMITDPLIISMDQIFNDEHLPQAYGQAEDLGSFHHFRHQLGLENSTSLRLLYFDLLLYEEFPQLGNQLETTLRDIQFEKNIPFEDFLTAFRNSRSTRGFVLQLPKSALKKNRRMDLSFKSYYVIPRKKIQKILIRSIEETAAKDEQSKKQQPPLF